MRNLIPIAFFFSIGLGSVDVKASDNIVSTGRTKTILVSLDGFGWDFYNSGRVDTPFIDSIRERGVQAKNMANAFPTLTFSNHQTLSTGVWVEDHEVVDNRMHDPRIGSLSDPAAFFDFRLDPIEEHWWNKAEPIWIAAEKAGVKTVCVNWVGCHAPFDGMRPTFWNAYKKEMTYEERVDRIIKAMFEEDSADFGMLYIEEPDDSSHAFGPRSQEYIQAIQMVDSRAVGYLLKRLGERADETNIIILSDHGTAQVTKDRIVVVAQYTRTPHVVSSWGPVAQVWPVEASQLDELYSELRAIDPRQATCFLKEDLPEHWHFKRSPRISPIVCVGNIEDDGVAWVILPDENKAALFKYNGHHGYPSDDEDSPLRPMFVAAGPGIKQTSEIIAPFPNVCVFRFVAQLLGIEISHVPAQLPTHLAAILKD